MLLTRPPLPLSPKRQRSFDLHVLGTPPAFILSQDQTRHPLSISPPVRTWLTSGSYLRCLSRDPGQVLQYSTWLFADVRLCSLQNTSLILDRNCCRRTSISPVAVLLSTLQLSKYMIERLFRSFRSTQALLHTSGTVSSVYISSITFFAKTPIACYLRQNDFIWIH